MVRNALLQGMKDNVATALEPLDKGTQVVAVYANETPVVVTANEAIPFGFKVAVVEIPQGSPIYKYGAVIGKTSMFIKPGDMVHVHNVEGTRGRGDLSA